VSLGDQFVTFRRVVVHLQGEHLKSSENIVFYISLNIIRDCSQ